MDRAALRAMLPTFEQYRQMTPFDRRVKVMAVMRAILDAIEAEGRQPDDWEIMDLATAVSALLVGWQDYARTLCLARFGATNQPVSDDTGTCASGS